MFLQTSVSALLPPKVYLCLKLGPGCQRNEHTPAKERVEEKLPGAHTLPVAPRVFVCRTASRGAMSAHRRLFCPDIPSAGLALRERVMWLQRREDRAGTCEATTSRAERCGRTRSRHTVRAPRHLATRASTCPLASKHVIMHRTRERADRRLSISSASHQFFSSFFSSRRGGPLPPSGCRASQRMASPSSTKTRGTRRTRRR